MDANFKLRLIEHLIFALPYLIMSTVCIIAIVLTIIITSIVAKKKTVKYVKQFLPEEAQNLINEKEDQIREYEHRIKELSSENKRYKSGYKEQDIQIRMAISELTGHKYEITLENEE